MELARGRSHVAGVDVELLAPDVFEVLRCVVSLLSTSDRVSFSDCEVALSQHFWHFCIRRPFWREFDVCVGLE